MTGRTHVRLDFDWHVDRHVAAFYGSGLPYEHSASWGSQLRDEIGAWEKSRIKQAKASAHSLVSMLKTQAAGAPAAAPPALPSGSGPDTTPTRNGDEPSQPKEPHYRTLPPSRSGKGRRT